MTFSGLLQDDTDIISIIGDETLPEDLSTDSIHIVPLRNNIFFPKVITPIFLGREKSISVIKKKYSEDKIIGVVSQKSSKVENPSGKDLYKYGTITTIIKVLELPDNTRSAILHGIKRFKIEKIVSEQPFIVAKVKLLEEKLPSKNDKEFKALVSNLKEVAEYIVELDFKMGDEALMMIKNMEDNVSLINFICSNFDIGIEQKQQLLKIGDIKKRALKLLSILSLVVQKLELKGDINYKVHKNISKNQKEFFLQQQIKEIQKELGSEPVNKEVETLRKKSKTKSWDLRVKKIFNTELEKLERIHHMSPEYGVQLSYLQTILDLPWNYKTKDNYDLKRAQEVLDKDHYGLEKVKDRILEHLSVLKLKKDLKSPILCLYGPPGVGKTSLGISVARALNRKYARMSLGGMRDESEIRGHRKTYIGAMPGRIIQSLKKVKSSNPVFVLDEIDKVGNDYKGDPASALLEVLDPEQNMSFFDNYLEIDYDLSNVLFIATANRLSTISSALLDRMEVIDVSGYILEEKIEIAKRHLLPKQLKSNGVKRNQCKLSNETIKFIIDNYTRESGVRGLDKKIASIVRKIAKEIAFERPYKATVSREKVIEYLGSPKFIRDDYEASKIAGIVTGLAWTAVGGEILTIETVASRGSGRLTFTGNLGKVMIESATIAYEYIKAHYIDLKIHPAIFKHWDIHIHIPEGAIPKDGPSAGITMTTALASLLTQRQVKSHVAMTGEITLSGKVLPVGGIKEKILAAKRAGIKEIVLSQKNESDIDEIKDIYRKGLKFTYVKTMTEVLSKILLVQKVENPFKIGIPRKSTDKKS